MGDMFGTGLDSMDAERAFAHAVRSRRRAALLRRLRGGLAACAGRLRVYEHPRSPGPGAGVREIPLEAIEGTLEPSRAKLFDGCFRPAAAAQGRWQRVWLAEQRGAVLPPISVVAVGRRYAVSDGHHRVSVARARGARTIDAVVEAA